MKDITLKGEKVAAIDLMDRGMDQLRTVWHALHGSDLSEGDHDTIANVLNDAILKLEPVREAINTDGGAT